MAKKPHFAFPFFPKDAVRITNPEGIRVWRMADGSEFPSKRAYFDHLKQKADEAALKANPNGKVEEDAPIPGVVEQSHD